MEEGTVSRLFRNLGDIDFDRPLYAHQEESIRHICSGHNAVITTGTGSGKTESFLFPILNELLYDLESRNTAVGVRAVFLYPMNALVNDQVRRLREILRRFPDVTYGFLQAIHLKRLHKTIETLMPPKTKLKFLKMRYFRERKFVRIHRIFFLLTIQCWSIF